MSGALPEKDTTATRLVEAVAGDVLALVLPGSGTFVQVLREYKKHKLDAAHEILIEEVRKGDRRLDDAEADEFVPIAYRYFKAAQDGAANRNIRLLAKLIGQDIAKHDLRSDRFLSQEESISNLSLEELICLSVLIEDCRHSIKQTGRVPQLKPDQFSSIKNKAIAEYPDHFQDESAVLSNFALLAGKGWVMPMTLSTYGGVVQPFTVLRTLSSG